MYVFAVLQETKVKNNTRHFIEKKAESRHCGVSEGFFLMTLFPHSMPRNYTIIESCNDIRKERWKPTHE